LIRFNVAWRYHTDLSQLLLTYFAASVKMESSKAKCIRQAILTFKIELCVKGTQSSVVVVKDVGQ